MAAPSVQGQFSYVRQPEPYDHYTGGALQPWVKKGKPPVRHTNTTFTIKGNSTHNPLRHNSFMSFTISDSQVQLSRLNRQKNGRAKSVASPS